MLSQTCNRRIIDMAYRQPGDSPPAYEKRDHGLVDEFLDGLQRAARSCQ